jgi:hypothetical protein
MPVGPTSGNCNLWARPNFDSDLYLPNFNTSLTIIITGSSFEKRIENLTRTYLGHYCHGFAMSSGLSFTKGKLVRQDLAGQMDPYNTFFNYGLPLVSIYVQRGGEKNPLFQRDSYLFFCIWNSDGSRPKIFDTQSVF